MRTCLIPSLTALSLRPLEPVGTYALSENARKMDCSICLQKLGDPKNWFVPCPRGHAFHHACFEGWRANAVVTPEEPFVKCPDCRGFTLIMKEPFDSANMEMATRSALDSMMEARRDRDKWRDGMMEARRDRDKWLDGMMEARRDGGKWFDGMMEARRDRDNWQKLAKTFNRRYDEALEAAEQSNALAATRLNRLQDKVNQHDRDMARRKDERALLESEVASLRAQTERCKVELNSAMNVATRGTNRCAELLDAAAADYNKQKQAILNAGNQRAGELEALLSKARIQYTALQDECAAESQRLSDNFREQEAFLRKGMSALQKKAEACNLALARATPPRAAALEDV
jgi:hypothetical protein